MISSALTVRTAATQFYLPASPGLASRTRRKLLHQWALWERHTANPSVHRIGPGTFAEFRASCLAKNLSPTYIETVISDVLTVMRACALAGIVIAVPHPGRRLKKLPSPKCTPTLAEFDTAYRRCEQTTWPKDCDSQAWWKGLLATAYFTALRRDDLLTLKECEIRDGWLTRKLRKTGRIHSIPVHPTLAERLEAVPKKTEYVFGRPTSLHQIRREMQTLFQSTDVTLQGLRRLSARSWERARTGCGALILGHSYRGALGSYLDPRHSLELAVRHLEVPECFGPRTPHRDEDRLLRAFRKLAERDAAAIVTIAEQLRD